MRVNKTFVLVLVVVLLRAVPLRIACVLQTLTPLSTTSSLNGS